VSLFTPKEIQHFINTHRAEGEEIDPKVQEQLNWLHSMCGPDFLRHICEHDHVDLPTPRQVVAIIKLIEVVRWTEQQMLLEFYKHNATHHPLCRSIGNGLWNCVKDCEANA